MLIMLNVACCNFINTGTFCTTLSTCIRMIVLYNALCVCSVCAILVIDVGLTDKNCNCQWLMLWTVTWSTTIDAWWRFGAVGSDVGQINEVTLRRARLVLEWVTVSGFNSWCGKFISV